MADMKNAMDRLGWLLRLPVILVWLDAGGHALCWRLSSVSEAALMLQSGAPLFFGEKENR